MPFYSTLIPTISVQQSTRLSDQHCVAKGSGQGGKVGDDSLKALTPLNFFLHHTRKTYNCPLLLTDTLSSHSIHPEACVHVDHFV